MSFKDLIIRHVHNLSPSESDRRFHRKSRAFWLKCGRVCCRLTSSVARKFTSRFVISPFTFSRLPCIEVVENIVEVMSGFVSSD
eukprot:m.806099 g.806099  ORF g.806099 m.806099 type:complete len:84 (+) comp59294_c0_seq11:212-463(+)